MKVAAEFGRLSRGFWKPFLVEKCGSRESSRNLRLSEFKHVCNIFI